MSPKTIISVLVTAAVALLLGVILGRNAFQNQPEVQHDHQAISQEKQSWTCSMHPQIQTQEPGDCPICGMDLIPVDLDSGNDLGPRALTMSDSALALAGVQTSVVKREFPEMSVHLVGRLEYDATRIRSLTARFPARIDRLFVNYMGAPVKKGEHLAMVFSPELSTAQYELLLSYKNDPESSLTQASIEKLRLWDLLPEQIDDIIKLGEASDIIELKAPIGGIVIEKQVNEGDYVKTGQPLLKIADLSKLWLFLDAYESDLPWLRYGQEVTFTVEAAPGESFSGRIAFIEPELNRESRTIGIRVDVPNPDGRLKAGMFARGIVNAQVSADGKVYAPDVAGKWISPMHPEIIKDGPGSCDVCGMDLVPAESLGYVDIPEGEAPIVVPASAVLRTGKRAVVYVQDMDAEQPTFEGREITLGPRAGDVFLVRDGLEENERVVTNGAFKIDSALQIQAKPSMMSMKSNLQADSAAEGPLQIPADIAVTILNDYFSLQDAMAADDNQASRDALFAMMQKTGHQGALPDLIHVMLATKSLAELRRPHFHTLSDAMIASVQENPDKFPGSIYQMSCPMVYDDREDNSANWLQSHEELLNPYWGDAMLHCGSTLAKLR